MKNIQLLRLSKHEDSKNFGLVEDGIYKDLNDEDDAKYRIALSYEQEEGEGQYPLEDILDHFFLHVSDFLDSFKNIQEASNGTIQLELGGQFDDVQKAKSLIGKRVYNVSYVAEDGNEYEKMVIE